MPSLDSIRAKIKQAQAKRTAGGGERKNRMLWLKSDTPVTVRFLDEVGGAEEQEVVWYNSFKEGINVFGPENWDGREEEVKFLKGMKALKVYPSEQYLFRVWNYEEKCIQIFASKATPVSVLFHLVKAADKRGTITDRDYTLEKSGSASSTVYTVEGEDKSDIPEEALAELKEFTWTEVYNTLRMVNKIPDEYASDEELAKREERAAKKEENSTNGKPTSIKGKAEKASTKKDKKEKEALPWEDLGDDNKPDKEKVKKAVDLDSYEDD